MTRCSELSLELGEPLAGTAPAERGVLVLEVPGTWGRDALAGSEAAARAEAAGLRVQAVRKVTRRYATDAPAAWLAGLIPGARFLERLSLEAVLEGDLSAEHPTGAGVLEDEPLLLCCTHSTRDACCALRGRPLHRALTAVAGTRTWHSSHLGGHRFAATMAALPLGLWLGRIPPEAAGEIVGLIREGRVPLPHLRGVAGLPPDAQAADAVIREVHGIDRVDDLRWVGGLDFETADGRTISATVHHVPTGVPRPVSCGEGAKVEDPGRFEVELGPARPLEETGRHVR